MPQKNNRSLSQSLIATAIFAIVVGALTLSGLALLENRRFGHATDQILQFVAQVRSIAAQRKDFAQTPGVDVWSDLEHQGQIIPQSDRTNPWNGDIRATVITNAAMRIETDLPAHDCRRLALYFLGYRPSDIGLQIIQAQSVADKDWSPLYPAPATAKAGDNGVEAACGHTEQARLALAFQIR